jgi:uncharacterized protein YaeQ
MYGATTLQFRLTLAIIERGVELNQKLILSRRADEPVTHVVLRLLAYCLFFRGEGGEALRFCPGPADRDGPDLVGRDLIGQPVEWIVCGHLDADELRHVLQHQRQAKVRVLFGADAEVVELNRALASLRKRLPGLEAVDFRQVSEELVARLAAAAMERQRWTVTLLEDHIYVDAEGITGDSPIWRPSIPLADA